MVRWCLTSSHFPLKKEERFLFLKSGENNFLKYKKIGWPSLQCHHVILFLTERKIDKLPEVWACLTIDAVQSKLMSLSSTANHLPRAHILKFTLWARELSNTIWIFSEFVNGQSDCSVRLLERTVEYFPAIGDKNRSEIHTLKLLG